jgi:hypothetical protein
MLLPKGRFRARQIAVRLNPSRHTIRMILFVDPSVIDSSNRNLWSWRGTDRSIPIGIGRVISSTLDCDTGGAR